MSGSIPLVDKSTCLEYYNAYPDIPSRTISFGGSTAFVVLYVNSYVSLGFEIGALPILGSSLRATRHINSAS